MLRRAWKSVFRPGLLLCDVILMIVGGYNIVSIRELADLPAEYQQKTQGLSSNAARAAAPPTVLRIGGEKVGAPNLLRYYLCSYARGDSVTVTDSSGSIVAERNIRLGSKYSSSNLAAMIIVGGLYFVFAIYIIVRHSSSSYATVLHAATVCAALMVVYEWGSIRLYPAWFNALRWFFFDAGIWMLPTMFLHFSFKYPSDKASGLRPLFIGSFYTVSITGVIVSAYYLVRIFFYGNAIHSTHYLDFHDRGSDVFLMVGLLCTIANLEHSALAIRDAYDRKRIYWVLLGISFGPLVYVFLILVPRTMLNYELVSESLMQYTLLVAPLMIYLAIRKTPRQDAKQGT